MKYSTSILVVGYRLFLIIGLPNWSIERVRNSIRFAYYIILFVVEKTALHDKAFAADILELVLTITCHFICPYPLSVVQDTEHAVDRIRYCKAVE